MWDKGTPRSFGTLAASVSLFDGGKTSASLVVVAYLPAQGVDDVDVMMVNQADSDHIGGLIDVLEMMDNPKALAKMQLNRLAPTG